MTISKITLYKLPIDNTYKNVFDFNNLPPSKMSLVSKIHALFHTTSLEIYSDLQLEKKKVLNMNKQISVTIDTNFIEGSPDIYNYNYAIIEARRYDGELLISYFYFYFLTNFKINNIIDNNYNITLHLEWDSWSNNIGKTDQMYSEVYCERRHLDISTISETGGGNIRYETYTLTNALEKVPLHKQIDELITSYLSNHVTFLDGKFTPLKILWQRVLLDNELPTDTLLTYKKNGDVMGGFTNEKEGIIPALNPLICVYIPVAVINTCTRKIVPDFQLYAGYAYELESESVSLVPAAYLQYTVNKKLINFNVKSVFFETSSHIVNSDLTFHCPFPESMITFDTVNAIVIFGTPSNPMDEIMGLLKTSFSNGILCFSHSPYAKVYPPEMFKSVDIPCTSYYDKTFTKSELISAYNSIDDIEKEKFVPQLHMYPYNYYLLVCGDKQFELSGYKTTEYYNLIYSAINRLNVAINCAPKEEDIDKHFEFIYANNVGNLVYSIDSFDQYMRENSGKITAQSIASLIGIIGGALSSGTVAGVAGIAGGIVGLAKTGGGMYDADKAQDFYKNVSEFAINDVEYQDDIFVVKCEIQDAEDRKRIVRNLNNYGIPYKGLTNLSSNFMTNFDYIKTVDCEIPSITNIEDRRIIESAFNSGITRWHIDTCNSIEIKRLSKQFCNLPLSLYDKMIEE